MASAFAHAFTAASLGAAVSLGTRAPPGRFVPRLLAAGVACSIWPDVDVIGFAAGVPYEARLGHRGLSHSLVFALVTAVVATALFFARPEWRPLRLRVSVTLFAITASHGLLDAMTDGGLGVAFFEPLDPTRYFLPARPVAVSPIGIAAFFTERSRSVLASELVFIALPVGALSLLVYAMLRARDRRSGAGARSVRA